MAALPGSSYPPYPQAVDAVVVSANFSTYSPSASRAPASTTAISTLAQSRPNVLKEHVSSPDELWRKRSMLSRQYKPSGNDGVGEQEEKVIPLRRNRTSYSANILQLTISDLQKLEELAEEATESDDPSKLRSARRRSLSLNIAPSVIDHMHDLRDPGDDVDAPIIAAVATVPSHHYPSVVDDFVSFPDMSWFGGPHDGHCCAISLSVYVWLRLYAVRSSYEPLALWQSALVFGVLEALTGTIIPETFLLL
ncbi:hypothetical protein C8Q80DRAFT_1276651 [Daedaleopsis nitida]|nr:hypothetical protein C8Q80DRAFT_1276651 [Daedaleopsis nitida]